MIKMIWLLPPTIRKCDFSSTFYKAERPILRNCQNNADNTMPDQENLSIPLDYSVGENSLFTIANFFVMA